MELWQLRHFVTVARAQSFGKAAVAMDISRFELARAINELEEQIGFQLLYTANNVARLTERGSAFLDAAENLIAHADAVESLAADLPQARGSTVFTVARATEAGVDVARRLLLRFRAAHSDVLLLERPMSTVDCVQALREGSSDMAVVGLPADLDGMISVRRIGAAEFGLAWRADRFTPAVALLLSWIDDFVAGQMQDGHLT
ncbi:LysR family transcriptional regulator [Kutzneria sp. CA-103260]|uniref:LysR family transcriptional regulator n=1 Tax=Kutzneria sp. CA-103260 TaxID=2802641 RepID=UPI001BA499F7|nr:LysR family transcriptional regulator [Kutzneria sp. CA-103260]